MSPPAPGPSPGGPSSRPLPVVLASASPRRSRVLDMLRLEHEVLPADLDEDVLPGEAPHDHVARLAREKAAAVRPLRPDALVLAGDTVVVLDGRILGKPRNRDGAVDMLLSLSGRGHDVFSGLALACPDGEIHVRVDRATVRFRSFGPSTARAYVDTGEPMDKAGSYGIQGLGASLVTGLEGDYYTVVGLSVAGFVELLDASGRHFAFGSITGGSEASDKGERT